MATLMAADAMIEEYSDGSARVFFTEAELAAMAADPVRFELVACRRLHPRSALLSDGSCGICEHEMSLDASDEDNAAWEAEHGPFVAPPPAPVVAGARSDIPF